MPKIRLDQCLVERGLCESRNQASRLIMAGEVLVNGVPSLKPGQAISPDVTLELLSKPPFVSRGGIKLQKALETFSVSVKDRICLDIGSSTGGFTDCLLQKGAALVYAVDSGTHQLHESLRGHPRVVVMENTNARNLDPSAFPKIPDLVVMDVSFISVTKILPALKKFGSQNFEIVSLIKPQFEATPEMVTTGGLVAGAAKHRGILQNLLDWMTNEGFHFRALIPSPITGAKSGNIEYLAHFFLSPKEPNPQSYPDLLIVVQAALKEAGLLP